MIPRTLFAGISLVALVACTPTSTDITTFEECVAAGNPVMESYPRQCRAGDQTFVEEISASSSSAPVTMIEIESPASNALVTSPLTVTGQARGGWYFEASFPVRLLDENGKELAVGPAQAQGDWMTENFVPFSITLIFEKPETKRGTLVLEKDNPSGLPENDASERIPVRFE